MKKSILAVSLLMAGLTAAPQAGANTGFSWGGDLRVRLVNWNNIPVANGATALTQWQYHRTRTRVWGAYGFTPDVSVKARLNNEFWDFSDGKPAGRPLDNQEFLSEIVPDNLYVDVNNLLGGKLNLRIGRQDMIYGTGKIILDGTPEDGSRTIFFDAIKAQYKLNDSMTIDLFGVMNNDEDPLTINSHHRNLSPNDIDESAVGIYVKNAHQQYPSELYYVYKHENDTSVANNDIDLHTFGARIMPKFSASLSGNLEVAVQDGEMDNNAVTDIGGWMVDAKLAYNLPILPSMKPVVDLSYYFLSGDDAGSTTDNEGWWSVFGRWSQNQELFVYSYIGTNGAQRGGPAWWSNLSSPSVGLNMAVTEKGKLDLRTAWLMADEDLGAGTGKDRGLYVTSKFAYQFSDNLSGRIVYEFLNPGNYDLSTADNAHFFQTQVIFKF
ncbi:MAG: alginate export family protein [Magnetococcales bacterium]|nr:alginate export family protein [Magnetococcales bacterium]